MNEFKNSLLRQELNYNIKEEEKEHEKLFRTLNSYQLAVYTSVKASVTSKEGKVFFLYGPGGTGKTYVYKTLIARLRSERKVILPVATSGIAATLLPGGRTAHSRFNIPIDLHDHSMCNIKPKTILADLIEKTSLTIWDEAPMAHRNTFEALDRTLRDIMRSTDPLATEKKFGGITMLLGGDFRKILLVIPQGSRQDTMMASINRSYLWDRKNVCLLNQNMRLNPVEICFSKWILNVGDGVAKKTEGQTWENLDTDVIEVDKELLISTTSDSLEEVFRSTYVDFEKSYAEKEYLRGRAILTPRNETVDEVNEFILSKVQGRMKEYFSSDSLGNDDVDEDEVNNFYTPEYLNNLKCHGIPNHTLQLKLNTPILMMRNINQKEGLCNGTRLMVSRLGERVIEAEIITGVNVGKKYLFQESS